MKMAGTGATFPCTPGAQRVIETSQTAVTLAYRNREPQGYKWGQGTETS
jgi:hypothetical protein